MRRLSVNLTRRYSMLGGAVGAALFATYSRADEGEHRILVVGDSQAQGLAAGLQRQLRKDRSWRVIDRSKISTGLVYTTNYDWPAQARSVGDSEAGAIAVVMFGANDRPNVRIQGAIDQKLADKWVPPYSERIRTVVAGLAHACPTVIWVGHPIVRDPVFAEDMAFVNKLYKSESLAAGAAWFSTWELFADESGAFASHGKGMDGVTTRLRADDGVHCTGAGYDLMANALLKVVRSSASETRGMPCCRA